GGAGSCPPIWAVARQAVHDDEMSGYRIPARSTVVLCPFVTHRHPDFWEDPSVFDPDRFTPERVAQRAKGAYFPFLSGPHQCIGNGFAMLEMRLIVAMVLREFDLELLPGQATRPKGSLALRPSGPVRMALQSVNRRTNRCSRPEPPSSCPRGMASTEAAPVAL